MIDNVSIGGISFRIAAAMICITCLFYTAVMRVNKQRKLRSRLFNALLIITLIGCMTGIISEFMLRSDWPFSVRLVITYICKYLYYSTHLMIIPVFWVYILIVCDVFHTMSKKLLIIRLYPVILLELAILSNPITHLCFTWDEKLRFYRGPAVYGIYFLSGLYLLFCFYLLGRYWNCMHAIQKIALFYFLGLAILGTIVQMLVPTIVCELMAEAIGFMGVMIMIENEEERSDYKTNAGNRAALLHDIKSFLLVKRNFYVICVRVVNAELYRRVTGYENYDLIMSKIADFLMGIDVEYEAYRTTAGNFFLVCPDASEEETGLVLQKIEDRFKESWALDNGSTNVNVKILCARCPEEFDDADDVLLLSEADMDDSDKVVYRGSDLDFLLRRVEVEKAIVRGMNEGNFQVMYQPVYHKLYRVIVSAEALLTLQDRELGEVSFAEFLAVAEEAGFIEELQMRMIESVFKFVQAGVMRNNENDDVRVIALHILSVQVLKPDLVNKVREHLQKYEIDPRYICFDISDRIVIQAKDIIEEIVEEFNEMGINCFLNNSDSGILGLHPSFIDRFKGVLINVKRHYESTDPSQSDIILRNRCAMIRQLGKDILLMGIDTRELYEKISDIDADLIIGNYMSEMVSKNEIQTKFWHKETIYEGKIN